MATAIDRQVEAFSESAKELDHDAIIAASKEACALHDRIIAGIHVSKMVEEHIAVMRGDDTVPQRYWVEGNTVTSNLLRSMMMVQSKAEAFAGDAKHAALMAEFRASIVRVRKSLSALQDLRLPAERQAKNRGIVESVDYNEFVDSAKKLPPAQSWYEEDEKKLRGTK
jgi:hypothetical protein